MYMYVQVRLVLMGVFGPQNIVVAVIVSARMGYLALNTVGSSQNLIRKLIKERIIISKVNPHLTSQPEKVTITGCAPIVFIINLLNY